MIAKQKIRTASRQLLAGCVLLALTGTTAHAPAVSFSGVPRRLSP